MNKLKTLFEDNLINFNIDLEEKNIVVFMSGGKDSSALLHLLLRNDLIKKNRIFPIMVKYPLEIFTLSQIEKMNNYWNNFDINLNIIDLGLLQDDIHNSNKPCRQCENLISKEFIKWLKNRRFSSKTLIFIGTHSWDVLGYITQIFLSNFSSSEGNKEENYSKITLSKRCYPILDIDTKLSIVRPFINIAPDEIIEYIHNNKIPVLNSPCKYKKLLGKQIVFKLMERLEINEINYSDIMTFAQKNNILIEKNKYYNLPMEFKIF